MSDQRCRGCDELIGPRDGVYCQADMDLADREVASLRERAEAAERDRCFQRAGRMMMIEAAEALTKERDRLRARVEELEHWQHAYDGSVTVLRSQLSIARKGLEEAAQSLETISKWKPEPTDVRAADVRAALYDVRGYAGSRANVARQAIDRAGEPTP